MQKVKRKVITQTIKNKISFFSRKGLTMKDISKVLKVSTSTVRKYRHQPIVLKLIHNPFYKEAGKS